MCDCVPAGSHTSSFFGLKLLEALLLTIKQINIIHFQQFMNDGLLSGNSLLCRLLEGRCLPIAWRHAVFYSSDVVI